MNKHKIEIGMGMGELEGNKIWRIGLMGINSNKIVVDKL